MTIDLLKKAEVEVKEGRVLEVGSSRLEAPDLYFSLRPQASNLQLASNLSLNLILGKN
jgi:hypothetical protein